MTSTLATNKGLTMKKTVSFSDFQSEFNDSQYKGNFTYEGLKALFDYLEELEQDTGEEIELDIVAIACDYEEYSSFEEFKENYSDDSIESIADLRYHTTVIMIDDESFIIQQF